MLMWDGWEWGKGLNPQGRQQLHTCERTRGKKVGEEGESQQGKNMLKTHEAAPL